MLCQDADDDAPAPRVACDALARDAPATDAAARAEVVTADREGFADADTFLADPVERVPVAFDDAAVARVAAETPERDAAPTAASARDAVETPERVAALVAAWSDVRCTAAARAALEAALVAREADETSDHAAEPDATTPVVAIVTCGRRRVRRLMTTSYREMRLSNSSVLAPTVAAVMRRV